MSTSPFADPNTFAQSQLTFRVPTGQAGIDERGNKVGQTDDITLLAWLDGGQSDLDPSESGAETSITCEGYLTEPMLIPPQLIHGAKGHGVVNGQEGEVILQPMLADNITPVREALGDRIKVEFRSRVQWGGGV